MPTAELENAARVLAQHALLLLTLVLFAIALAAAAVAAAARAAMRYGQLLWGWVDWVVPGRLRPLTYLAVHLGLGLLAAFALGAFTVLAQNVVAEREIAIFDHAFAQALGREVSPRWHEIFWFFTWLGSGYALGPAALVVAVAVARAGQPLLAAVWFVGQAAAWSLNYGLKLVVGRPRPDGADPLLIGSDLSFPSGHAMSSVVFSGVAAYLVVRLVTSLAARVLLVAALLAFSLVIGFSRLYLGVHYASDVAAGFIAGTGWVAVCVSAGEIAARRRRRRHDARERQDGSTG